MHFEMRRRLLTASPRQTAPPKAASSTSAAAICAVRGDDRLAILAVLLGLRLIAANDIALAFDLHLLDEELPRN